MYTVQYRMGCAVSGVNLKLRTSQENSGTCSISLCGTVERVDRGLDDACKKGTVKNKRLHEEQKKWWIKDKKEKYKRSTYVLNHI
jgi:hypothetical protein